MTENQGIKDIILEVQKDLLVMGAELSCFPEDFDKLTHRIDETDISRIENIIDKLQKDVELPKEFIYPGKSVVSAQIDVARTIIRRAERKAVELKKDGLISSDEINKYLNRLADMLFTLARFEEGK